MALRFGGKLIDGIFFGAPGGVTYEPESETLFAAMTVAPDNTRKGHINTLIAGLKADGIWSAFDILYVLAAHDAQAARLNWKAPASFEALAVNSPTFETDRGYTGDGSSSRLRTQYTPSTDVINLSQNNASAWSWSRTDALSGRDIGNSGGNNNIVNPRNVGASGTMTIGVFSAGANGAVGVNSIGFWGVSRAAAGTMKGWKNGAQHGTDISQSSTGLSAQEQWICGSNSSGFSVRQIAAAAWASALTGLEDEFYTRMLTYMQAVGAA